MIENEPRGPLARAGLAALALAAGAVVAGLALGQSGAGTIVMGQEKEVFGAKVATWARLDASGAVTEVGLTLPLAVVEKASVPAAPPAGGEPAELPPEAVLEFPEAVKKTTFFDNADLSWGPAGHPPERYMTPHWDMHFFSIPRAAVDKIDCKDLTPTPNDRVAAGWVPPVPPNAPPAELCVPQMGFHAVPTSEFESPGTLKPGLFDATTIATYYGGEANGVEPMITREKLLKRESFELPVPALPVVGRKTLFPTTFKATYDKATDSYSLAFGGFRTTER